MKGIRLSEIVKLIKFEGGWGELEAKYCLQIQFWLKYMSQTLVLVWNSLLQKKFNFKFPTAFRLHWQNFHFERKTDQAIIPWRFAIPLIFNNFLRSWVLSRSATREATRIYHVYYQYSRFVSLVVKEKFGKTSKSLKILWPRFSEIFSFAFDLLIKSSDFWKQSFCGWNVLYLSRNTS